MSERKIVGFDSDIIHGVLREHFDYAGPLLYLSTDEKNENGFRIYSPNLLDITVVPKEKFESRQRVIDYYNHTFAKNKALTLVVDHDLRLAIVGWGYQNG